MWNGESLVFHGTSFTGVFDGNAHTISHLTITGSTYLGLFGQLASGAEVKNLGVVDVNVVGSGDCVGGLLALNWLGTVTHCYSTGAVSGSGSVGAVVGSNGEFASPGGVLTNCYSIGVVSGESEVGGLVGTNACPEETTCSAHVTNCFWDIDISGLPNMCGSQHNLATGCNDSFGRTTAEMQTARTFLTATGTTFDRSGVIRGGGWDFVGETKNGTEDIWAICEGLDYPKLAWQFVIGDYNGDGHTDFMDFCILGQRWLGTDSSFWCGAGGTDLTNDGKVDFDDLRYLADNWLAEDQ